LAKKDGATSCEHQNGIASEFVAIARKRQPAKAELACCKM